MYHWGSVIFLLLLAVPAFAGIQVSDYSGKTLYLDKPAQRIVALAPHIVENVYSAGAGDKLVAVVDYSDYPEDAKSKPIVGGYHSLSVEKILSYKPDLVLAWYSGNKLESIQKLVKIGIPVYFDKPKTTDDVARSIRDIAKLTGTEDKAEPVVGDYLAKIEKLQKHYGALTPVRVFYQVWNDPLQTLNGDSLISDIISLCGGVNIFSDEPVIAPLVSVEGVIEKDPHVILGGGMATEQPELILGWKKWDVISAVKTASLYYVHPDLLHRHSVRIALGAERACNYMDETRKKLRNL